MKYFSKQSRLFSVAAVLLLVLLAMAGVPASTTADFGVQEGETGTIAGTVTDALKMEPISGGVSVSVYDHTQTQVGWAVVIDGYYEVNGLPLGSYKVWIQDDLAGSGTYISEWYDDAPGWDNVSAALAVALTVPADNVTVDEDLWPGQATLSGRVTGENETPIADAYVSAYGPSEANAFTDGDGYYRFPELYCGSYEVSAYPPYGVNALPAYTSSALVLSGATVDFSLSVGGVISGRVTDELGTGVADAMVYAPDGYAFPDPDGYYSIVGLPSGNWTVTAAPSWDVNLLSVTALAEVLEGSTTPLDFVLPPGGTISGRVTDPADAGVSATWVAAWGPDSRGDYSDGDGYYSIVGLTGGSYSLTANPPYGSQLLPGSGSAIVVENATATVDFALLLEGVIAGRVANNYNGAGVPGVYLDFTGPDLHFASAVTDNYGYYHVPQCVSGNWTISANPPPVLELLPGNASAVVVNGGTTTANLVLQTCDITPPPAPILVYPVDGKLTTDNTPWLDWSDVTDPSSVLYRLQVDDDADFSSPVVNKSGLTTSSRTISPELAIGTYYWRVRAQDGPGNLGAWTAAWSFSVTPPMPALLYPANGKATLDNTPWLDWSDVTDPPGITYSLQVDDNADFSSPVVNKTGLTTSSRTISPALADGTYYWRVKAVDGEGNATDWTAAWSIKVDTVAPSTPTLLYPANGKATRDNTPWLDWSSVSDPSGVKYQLQVDDSSDFSSLLMNKSGLTTSSRTLTTLADGTCYWRVRATDGAGNASAWTAAWSFTVDTVTPSVPDLLYPADSTVTADNTPWLDWSDVTDATGVTYQIQVDNNADFSSPVVNKSGLTTSSRTLTTLADGTCYWRVRATDGAGSTSAWTSAWTFTVDT